MKTCETLPEMIEFLLRKHTDLRTGGVTSYKMMRKPNGTRIPFEITNGFKILKFDVLQENCLSVNQMAAGYSFKGQQKHVLSSQLFLQDLVLVNAYDLCAEFFSVSSIDFTYITHGPGNAVQMLQEWISDDAGTIRAQWTHKDENIERLLDEISVGRKVKMRQTDTARYLQIDNGDI